jgi:hypothetical protein
MGLEQRNRYSDYNLDMQLVVPFPSVQKIYHLPKSFM